MNASRRNKVLFLLLLLLHGYTITAQTGEYNFINFSSKEGMSSNAVNAILKDKYGFMWFATDDGLNKFDGEAFTVYRYNPADSNSLGDNKIYTLCEDPNGNLWVGTGESLSFYDRRKDVFIQYPFIKGTLVRALCLDHAGNLWVGSYAGLYMLDTHTGNVNHYLCDPVRPDKLISNTIVSIFEDSQRRLWIGTNEGLHLYVREQNNFTRFLHSGSDTSSISDNIIRVITEDANGNVWFGTNDGGLSQLLPGGQRFRNYKYHPGDIQSLSCNRIFAITPDYEGKLNRICRFRR